MDAVANPESVRERIDASLEELENLAQSTRSRAEIMSDLTRDLADYYGYLPELAEMLLQLFSPAECVEYMEASDRPRPLVIRTNTLKTNRKALMESLTKRGAVVESIDWSKVAIKVTESTVPIGATPEYLAGHYMLQSASSMNPVMALDPIPGERVLDMSCAPGGKVSYIAQLMKNSGTVIANDLKPKRQKATVGNLHRLGIKNTIVCCYDGRQIGKAFRGFDRVLLDAPCSGLGIIARDQSVKLQRTMKDVQRVAHLQKELLRAAVDAVDANSKTGGVIVYSTCSISVEENEQVVQYILSKRHVKLVETGLAVGKPGLTRHQERRFHPSMALTRRFYPHAHNMDGFYVAKFKKLANGVKGNSDDDDEEKNYQTGDESDEYDEEGSEEELSQEDEDSEEEEEVPRKKSKIAVEEEEDSEDDQVIASEDDEDIDSDEVDGEFGSEDEDMDVDSEDEDMDVDSEEEEVESEEEPEPVKPTKKQAKTPVKEIKTPAKTPVKEVKTPAKTPVKEVKTPVKETKTPAKETKTPVKETKTPVKETKTPVKETKTPVKETKTPVKTPAKEAKTPAKTPVKESQPVAVISSAEKTQKKSKLPVPANRKK